MVFGANKTPIEVIWKGAFGRKYFRDICSGVAGKWYRKSWKELDQLKTFIQKIYCSDYYDVSVNTYGVNEIDPYDWFQLYFGYWLGRRSQDDERQIKGWKKIVSRFRGKLVKVVKNADSKPDNYSILPKFREILLHWGYELTEKYFLLT